MALGQSEQRLWRLAFEFMTLDLSRLCFSNAAVDGRAVARLFRATFGPSAPLVLGLPSSWLINSGPVLGPCGHCPVVLAKVCCLGARADGFHPSVVFLGFLAFLGLPAAVPDFSSAPFEAEDGAGSASRGCVASMEGPCATGSHPFLMFSATRASATRSASAAEIAVLTVRSSGVFRSGL